MTSANANVISDTASATSLAALTPEKISTTAPRAGSSASTVSQGRVMIASLAQPAQHDDYADNRSAQRHGQRIGADEPVLHPTQPSRHRANRGSCAVHRAIDSVVLEPDQPRGELLTGTHEHGFVECVAVEIVASGQSEEGPALRLRERDVATRAEKPHADGNAYGDHYESDECDSREVQQARRLCFRHPTTYGGIKPADDPVVEHQSADDRADS